MDLKKNKRGYVTLTLIAVVFVSLILMVILGVSVWGFSMVDDTFSGLDFMLGNTSFNETYQDTLQPGIVSMTTTVPVIISTGVLLGMVISLMFVGYSVKRIGKLWILLDIGFIIVATILASSVSSGFVSFMNSNPELLEIFSTTLSAGSRYVINLPIVIPIIGVIIMLATHLTTREKEEEEPAAF